jgi:hypothetical protein
MTTLGNLKLFLIQVNGSIDNKNLVLKLIKKQQL